jgi:beta-N-acetylhexosaminidase
MIEHLNSLSFEQKTGQLFFIGIAGPVIDQPTLELLNEVSPGGVCLFARNIKELSQTRDLLDGLRSALPATPFLSIDQEGGLVDRLRRVMTPMPAANKITNELDAAHLAEIIGETLRILGFNMDFAPVVDVIDDERSKYNNGLTSRTFGRSKEDAASFAAAFLSTLQANGIVGCLKHFPGLGASRVDSHEELPMVEIANDELFATDLIPYRELITSTNVNAVMVAHAAYPKVGLQESGQNGKLLPSSLSYNFITKLLREDLQFDGLVITDDLEMGAIVNNFGIGDACKMAITAGVDMLAICADPTAIREGYNAVRQAVESGEIGMDRIDESLVRIANVKAMLPDPPVFDPTRLHNISMETAQFSERLASV